MPFLVMLVNKLQLNLGVLVVLLHVSPVLLEEVLIVPVRELLVTCAEVVECLVRSVPGEDGTARSFLGKRDTQWPLLLPHPLCLHW